MVYRPLPAHPEALNTFAVLSLAPTPLILVTISGDGADERCARVGSGLAVCSPSLTTKTAPVKKVL
jgi:hypothetical protein